jgi:hypothetical protein
MVDAAAFPSVETGAWNDAAGKLECMSADRVVVTFDELSDSHRGAPASLPDDVTLLFDGRRIDTKDKVLEWLAEIEADRTAGRSALDELP